MNKASRFLDLLGPGFIAGASDDDPSGIATYAQTGALFGYSQLWTALFSTPLMVVVQEMSGRIGMATGKGLAGVIRKHYPRSVLSFAVLLLVVANTINIGADLGAMAAAGSPILRVPSTALLAVVAALTLLLEVFVSYERYAKFLKYLTFALLTYVATTLAVRVEWRAVILATLVPSFSPGKDYWINIVAILGTSISPYLFFWQAGEEVEEEVVSGKLRQMGAGIPRITTRDIRDMRLDTVVGMVFSSLMMWFIIITTASTLHVNHVFNIHTADQAAAALRPLAGDFASLLFALGIVGTGLLAVPVLAGSASYAISEALGWKEGLYRRPSGARGFYAVIALATAFGFIMNFTPVQPFEMLYYSAILNGICAPPLIALLVIIGNNSAIMGKHANSRLSSIGGWLTAGVMAAASIGLLLALLDLNIP